MGKLDRSGRATPSEPVKPAGGAVRAEGTVPARPRFPCFDGLRALAAMMILVFHVSSLSTVGVNSSRHVGPYFSRLDVGVAMFFVISGFLLYRPFVAAHFGGPTTSRWRDFWWRRALRIYPAYWIVLTVAILFFRSTHLHGFGDYARHYALVQIYTPGYGLAGIVPTWSLAVEVSFYAALPIYAAIIGAVVTRAGHSRALLVEAGGATFVYLLGLGVRAFLFYKDHPGTPSAQWLPAECDVFALGMGLAVFSAAATAGLTATATNAVARALRWLGEHAHASWLLAAAAFVTVSNIGLPTTFAVDTFERKVEMVHQILYGLVALFVVLPAVFGPQDRGLGRRVLRSRVAVWLGIVSYGIFLWHFDWMNQLSDWRLDHGVHALRFPVMLVLTIAVTLVVAALSWFLVEQPILRRKQRPPWRRVHRPTVDAART
jgi:peptidoglycan/LPS O-acetylase OafA/YrhL